MLLSNETISLVQGCMYSLLAQVGSTMLIHFTSVWTLQCMTTISLVSGLLLFYIESNEPIFEGRHFIT